MCVKILWCWHICASDSPVIKTSCTQPLQQDRAEREEEQPTTLLDSFLYSRPKRLSLYKRLGLYRVKEFPPSTFRFLHLVPIFPFEGMVVPCLIRFFELRRTCNYVAHFTWSSSHTIMKVTAKVTKLSFLRIPWDFFSVNVIFYHA